MIVSAICASGNSDKIRGNGDIVTFDRTMSAFEKIRITTVFSSNNGFDGKGIIYIHSGEEYRLSLTIDSNLNQYVEINTIDNVLEIRTNKKIKKDFIVDIYSPKISSITIDSIGKIEIIDAINASSLSINISGAGEIKGNIECEDFFADVGGAGKLTMTGYSKNADINISGVGNFNGQEFRVDNASIDINGVGKATIWTVDNLVADISGIGSIKYRGTPNINFSRGGLGSIKKIK
jgi:hypothetical protein